MSQRSAAAPSCLHDPVFVGQRAGARPTRACKQAAYRSRVGRTPFGLGLLLAGLSWSGAATAQANEHAPAHAAPAATHAAPAHEIPAQTEAVHGGKTAAVPASINPDAPAELAVDSPELHDTDVPVTSSAAAAEAKGLLKLGESLTGRDDFAAAEIAYRRILSSGEFSKADQMDALRGLANTYRRQGTFTKAAAIYEKYLKQFPDDRNVPDVMLDLGRTLRAMGAHRMAINRFYSVINSTLKLPSEGFDHYQMLAKTAQFEIAETHYESGNFTEAGKFFSRLRLLDLAPSDRARAHFKSACSQQLAGNLDDAIVTLRAYLDQWPQDENVPEARYLLATTLRQLNRSDESLAVTLDLLKSEQTAGDKRRWSYWQRRTGNQLANEFFTTGDTRNALSVYEGLLALAPDAAWRLPITYQVGLCQERLRVIDRARGAYREIIDTVAQAATGKNPPGDELNELSRMASWRLAHLDWDDKTDRQLTSFFSTTTGQHAPTPVPTPSAHVSPGSPSAASTDL